MTPQETYIIEDSDTPMPSWVKESPYRSYNIQWISNGARCGQVFAIDTLYEPIKTDYIFHCEDDFEFIEAGGWMRRSIEILREYPNIWMVSLRGTDCNGHPLVDDPAYPFKIQQPYWHGPWGGFSWNPGARRQCGKVKAGRLGVLPALETVKQ